MNREQIAEEIAESILKHSSSIEEVIKNTDYFLSVLAEDVQAVLHDKILSRSLDKDQTDRALKGLGWY